MKNCPVHDKFTIKHEKQTLQVKAMVKLNGVDYCTSAFGLSHRSNNIDYCTSLFDVSHRQCHGEVNGVNYNTSLFGVTHRQFHSEVNGIDY